MLRFVRYTMAALVMMGLLAVVAVGCGDDEGDEPIAIGTPNASGFPVTLEGSDGTSVTLQAPPRRMVVLSPGHVETLFAIGAGDAVVAVDENTDYPPEAAAIELKLSGLEPSAEAIANLDPDLVIMSFAPEGFVEQLQGLDVPVWLDAIDTDITTVEGVFDSIEELGRATGHVDEAGTVVAGLQERLDGVRERIADIEERPRVYLELDVFEGFNTVSPDDFVGDLIAKLNGQNIVEADEGNYPTLQQEAIVSRNPEVIVLADAEFGQTPEVVSARPAWETIAAVQSDRVFAIDPDIISRPGPRIIDALEALGALLYPGVFGGEESRSCWACSDAAA